MHVPKLFPLLHWFCQKCPFSGTKKWHFGCPNKNSETTFISPTSPKIDGIAFRFKRVPLLEGYPANFKIQYFLQCDIAILGTPLIGGLKCISQEFFMVLFYTTELQYKSRGPKDMKTKNMTNKGKSSSYTDRQPQMAFYIAYQTEGCHLVGGGQSFKLASRLEWYFVWSSQLHLSRSVHTDSQFSKNLLCLRPKWSLNPPVVFTFQVDPVLDHLIFFRTIINSQQS